MVDCMKCQWHHNETVIPKWKKAIRAGWDYGHVWGGNGFGSGAHVGVRSPWGEGTRERVCYAARRSTRTGLAPLIHTNQSATQSIPYSSPWARQNYRKEKGRARNQKPTPPKSHNVSQLSSDFPDPTVHQNHPESLCVSLLVLKYRLLGLPMQRFEFHGSGRYLGIQAPFKYVLHVSDHKPGIGTSGWEDNPS